MFLSSRNEFPTLFLRVGVGVGVVGVAKEGKVVRMCQTLTLDSTEFEGIRQVHLRISTTSSAQCKRGPIFKQALSQMKVHRWKPSPPFRVLW